MLSQDRVLGLIGRIYDAAADERLWPVFLEDFANAVDGTATTLIYHDMTSLRASRMISIRGDEDFHQRYVGYYSARDPYRAAWLARFDRAAPEGIYIGEQLVAPDRLRRNEYYNDFAVPLDIVHQFCGPIVVNSKWACTLSSHRPENQEPFGDEDANLLRVLWPHLQRAILFHRKFAELEGHQRASLEALDRLLVGVILLNDRSEILTLNREALRVLRQNDGLSSSGRGIRAARQKETQDLGMMIAGAAKTGAGQGSASGGLLAVSRPSGKRPYTVVVAPVARNAFPMELQQPSVIVFVTDPEREPQSLPEALARIYELTPAESRVADLLMQGETVVRTAERLGISHNTARTHLQRIYQKTNTSHQGALVRLLQSAIVSLD